jgi:hypothetical protein
MESKTAEDHAEDDDLEAALLMSMGGSQDKKGQDDLENVSLGSVASDFLLLHFLPCYAFFPTSFHIFFHYLSPISFPCSFLLACLTLLLSLLHSPPPPLLPSVLPTCLASLLLPAFLRN